MQRMTDDDTILARIDLTDCPEGDVLSPLQPRSETDKTYFESWETPLAPWGGFRLSSDLTVVRDGDRPVLEFRTSHLERALVTGHADARDYAAHAEILPVDQEAPSHVDRSDCSEAFVGIMFRIKTSRQYYEFGVEGKRRAVLYRRNDEEWSTLAAHDVTVPNGYLNLHVALDGDGIRCRCPELDVDVCVTDTMYPAGKAGLRCIGLARMAGIEITATASQTTRNRRRAKSATDQTADRARDVPDPVLVRTLDLAELGGDPQFADFAEPGRFDMLIRGGGAFRAQALDGRELWSIPETVSQFVMSPVHAEHGRLIYALTGQRETKERVSVTGAKSVETISDELIVMQGATGEIVARRKLPDFPGALRRPDLSPTSGNLTGAGPFDIVLREWRTDCGDGGTNLWAYAGTDLAPLWHAEVKTPYGHHYSLQWLDVNEDGRDELLAGGTLFSADGKILWTHDLAHEMARINGAHHYDAVAFGRFADDPTVDPVAFLLGGSAGLYVVDGLTGRTRMTHRIGHAQGRFIVRVRDDMPGQQILAACRWGNMGILTLFSGHGDRLWSCQPDYVGQGTCGVAWGSGPELIWANTSAHAQAFYDGHGRLVKRLPIIEALWAGRMRRDVKTNVIRMGTDPRPLLCVTVDKKLHAFGPRC